MSADPKKAEATRYRWMTLDEAFILGVDDLVHLQWSETMNDGVPLVVDWPRYRRMERDGVYKAIAAVKAGVLIGYNAFFVEPTPHHSTTLVAMNDVLFLHPDYRHGMEGVLLVSRSEKMLVEELGVKKISYGSKPYLDLGSRRGGATLADLLRKLGYQDAETVHAKVFLGAGREQRK